MKGDTEMTQFEKQSLETLLIMITEEIKKGNFKEDGKDLIEPNKEDLIKACCNVKFAINFIK